MTIVAIGADGGDRPSASINGGSGGSVTATFNVTAGDMIRIIAGAAGADGSSDGGGGGGTVVINCGNPANCANGTLLVVAGGGGGARSAGGGASNTAGTGNGGSSPVGKGGGGINGGGASNGGEQASMVAVSAGGSGSGTGAASGGSGFGGGGGGVASGVIHGGGGGGGYSGGNGGASGAGGSGGTNYVDAAGTSVTNTSGINAGSGGNNSSGSVTISFPGMLPVDLVHFTANQYENVIDIQWQTTSEQNNEGFEVQHSNDARQWRSIGFVEGRGTPSQGYSYAYTDADPMPGINYYRLRQIDYDGHFEYSPVVTADLLNRGGLVNLRFFPNPARQGITSLFLPEAPEAEGFLKIFDHMGRQVFYQKIALENGGQSVPVDLSNCPPGIYIARLELGSEVRTERLVIAK